MEAFCESGVEAALCENVRRLLWEKLFVNMTSNAITSIVCARIGLISSNPHASFLAGRLIEEACRVAAAEGIEFDPKATTESICCFHRTGPIL